MSDSQAYASAVERAKQITSKIENSSYNSSASSGAGMKRGAQGSYEVYQHTEKRAFLNDKSASVAAAEAVAKLNQKLGVPQSNSMQNYPQYPNATNGSNSLTIQIPDRLVGLIIGKKGEQITALQAESNCKVQITQEQTGPERPITLTGNNQQIEHARRLINDLIQRAERGAGPNPMMNQQHPGAAGDGNFIQIEIPVPGNKAGLVIGKGGETIKSLQEEHGVKMVLIQQTNVATAEDKPLRISGDASRVERVKQIIVELINGKMAAPMGGGGGGGGIMSPQAQDFQRFAVPAEKAGLVIGKGGETIKEICKMSNCHVEISKDPPPSNSLKLFNIRGSPDDIIKAKRLISDRAGIPFNHDSYGQQGAGYNVYAYMQDPGQQSNNNAMPAPSVDPHTGMYDYSAAWIEYYRRLGMPEQAEKIMMQAQQQRMAAAQGQAAGAYGGQQQSGAPQGGQDYSAQWQAWQQQWQAYQQQSGGGHPGAPQSWNAAAQGVSQSGSAHGN